MFDRQCLIVSRSSGLRTSPLNFKLKIARALGFEPRSKVLETRMLPLHHARRKTPNPLGASENSLNIELLFRNKVLEIFHTSTLQIHKPFPKSPLGDLEVLFDYLSYLTSPYSTSALTDGKFQTFLHRNRLDQFYFQ